MKKRNIIGISLVIAICVLLLLYDPTIQSETESSFTISYSLKITPSNHTSQYVIYCPIPIVYYNNTTTQSYYNQYIYVKSGSATISSIQTDYGFALRINGSGEVKIRMNIAEKKCKDSRYADLSLETHLTRENEVNASDFPPRPNTQFRVYLNTSSESVHIDMSFNVESFHVEHRTAVSFHQLQYFSGDITPGWNGIPGKSGASVS